VAFRNGNGNNTFSVDIGSNGPVLEQQCRRHFVFIGDFGTLLVVKNGTNIHTK
jgi:hypothetical protein